MAGSVRVDSWLWSVRVYKTRSSASSGCRAGHVRVNEAAVKPAQHVSPGDIVSVRKDGRDLLLEVVQVISKRVGAPDAVKCYIDHSPPPPPKEVILSMPRRDRGAGRPTKRERREMERFMRRRQ